MEFIYWALYSEPEMGDHFYIVTDTYCISASLIHCKYWKPLINFTAAKSDTNYLLQRLQIVFILQRHQSIFFSFSIVTGLKILWNTLRISVHTFHIHMTIWITITSWPLFSDKYSALTAVGQNNCNAIASRCFLNRITLAVLSEWQGWNET